MEKFRICCINKKGCPTTPGMVDLGACYTHRKDQILPEFGHVSAHNVFVKTVMTQLSPTGEQHGHSFVPFFQENRVGIHVEHPHAPAELFSQRPQLLNQDRKSAV